MELINVKTDNNEYIDIFVLLTGGMTTPATPIWLQNGTDGSDSTSLISQLFCSCIPLSWRTIKKRMLLIGYPAV